MGGTNPTEARGRRGVGDLEVELDMILMDADALGGNLTFVEKEA